MPFDGTYTDLNNTCSIQRHADAAEASTDDWNRTAQAWADVATGVRCRKNLTRGRAIETGVVADFWVELPYGTDVTFKDRIVVDGATLDVVHVDPNPKGARHHCEAYCNVVLV